ncbi:MAG: cation transporter [Rhodobacteraceae bacterium]|nr:cation transporter [Paracoccaceae bacterium]
MSQPVSDSSLAAGSIAVALIGLGLKLLAFGLTGSVALFSDAMESLVNVAGAVMAWGAIRYAARPADADHPFGHHKSENVSALVEGLFVILAAGLILWEAVPKLWAPEPAAYVPLGFAAAGAAALLNLVWAQILLRRGRAKRSPALQASGTHLMGDVWTTLGVLLGLGLVMLTGWQALDPLLAILVALNILREGAAVVRQSADGLMDGAASALERDEIETAIRGAMDGALQAHGLKTRHAGRALFVEFHLVVPTDMTVGTAHDICDRIEAAIEARLPEAQTTIHVEPAAQVEADGLAPEG